MDHKVGRHLLAALAVSWAAGCPGEISSAASYQSAGPLVGILQRYTTAKDESLLEVARKFGLGFNAIVAANPTLDPWAPPAGSQVDLPTAWILPDWPNPPAVVINLPELRLYCFPDKPSGTVATFPLGIGDQGQDTPLGSYQVIDKITNPAWHVPKTIRSESPRLPKIVPPGPDNPLGSHALRLSRADILIHGTNRPWGIGRRSSHGCLRLYPDDMVELFKLVGKGTRVNIISQPIKVCSVGNRVYVETHRHESDESAVGRALQLLADRKLLGKTDFVKLIRAVEEMKGFPVDVTLLP